MSPLKIPGMRWTRGLATPQTGQMNWRYNESCVATRLPGKEAAVLRACENQPAGDHVVRESGLVLIFCLV